MLLIRLFFEFFRAGLFAVGGGLATIPFLSDMGARTGWFSAGELADMIAVSESTPGPLGVNMASYVGFNVGGPVGCVAATLGLVAPSILIILIIARFLVKFRQSRVVEAVFYGLRPASTALITVAGLEVVRMALLRLENWGSGQVLPFNSCVIISILRFSISFGFTILISFSIRSPPPEFRIFFSCQMMI